MINGRITVTNFQRRTNIMAVVNPNYIPWPYLSKLCSKFKSAQDYKLYPGLIRNLNSKTCILTFYYCYYIYEKRVIWREEESTLITSLVRKYYSYIASIIYFPTSDFIVQKILLGNFFENFDSNAWNSDTSNYAQLVIRIRRNGKAKFRQTFPPPPPPEKSWKREIRRYNKFSSTFHVDRSFENRMDPRPARSIEGDCEDICSW